MADNLLPQDALEEMDRVITVSRAYQQAGESCAEIDPDMVRRWRMALTPPVLREIYASAALRSEGAVTMPASALEHDAKVVGDLRRRIAELEAPLAQPHASAVPAGWRLVPLDPTASMVTAGCRAPTVQTEDSYLRSMVTCAYHAMVSAAPPAPSAPAERED